MVAAARLRRPTPKALAAPQRDPRFQKLTAQLKRSATQVKRHPPAAQKAREAQAAAKGPANEKAAGAKAKQVDKMKEAEGKKPESSGFLALLRAEIEKVMPQNLDEADKFMKGGEKAQIKGAAAGNVSQQKQDAAGPVEQASKAAPDTSGVPAKESAPIPPEASPPPAPLDTANAVPAPQPDAAVSQEGTKKDADQQLKDADVTETQLKKANDPRFSGVLTAKGEAVKVADTSPGKYRGAEKLALVQGVARASGDAKKGLAAAALIKSKSGAAVKTRQQLAQEKDEAERKKVTDTIEGIYNQTKLTVEQKLSTLETDVGARFDRGMTAALDSMQSWANAEIDKFKKERYSGVTGWGRWLADLFRPAPEGIKQILRQARARFAGEMDALAVEIAGTVDRRLKEAKDEVARGQARIDGYVKSLPASLQAVGKDAQAKVADRFQELTSSIDDKANELAQQLAQKYKEAFDKADQALKKLEEENAGALKKLADKIGEVIKALLEFKDKLMAVLKKGWEVIKKILADPIGFISNLIGALKKGFGQFVDKIGKHLKAGFFKWLLGPLGEAGITLPTDLNVWSVLKLVLDVLGLTVPWMKGEVTKLVGARNMAIIEKVIEYIMVTIRGGPQALWAKLKEDLSNLKEMVIDAIQSWLITTVVKSAVTKILSMFNPAGAIVQAIIMIYNVVMWVIDNASRIVDLISAVVDSAAEIAAGNITGAANWIEKALADFIPVAIDFLARLVGLGGFAEKVKGFIQKVQTRVRAAVLGWLKKAWEWVKKLFGKGTEKGKPDERTEEQRKKALDTAMAAASPLVKDKSLSDADIRQRLAALRNQHKVRVLDLVVDSKTAKKEVAHIHGENSPPVEGPSGERETAPASIEVGDWIKVGNWVAQITAMTDTMISYSFVDKRKGSLISTQTQRFMAKLASGEIVKHTIDRRGTFMGSNIDRAVLVSYYKDRKWYQVAGTPPVEQVMFPPPPRAGNWVNLSDCDASHEPDDAVTYWNKEGYKYGPRSPQVKNFMKNPRNYIFEPSGPNRSRGSRKDEEYRPPMKD